MDKEFHPSGLNMGANFRESLRYKESFSSDRLNHAQAILSDALAKEGHETLTRENFAKVSEHMRKDPRWHSLHSAGDEFHKALGEHLGVKMEED